MGRLGVERATYLPVTELTHFLDHFLIYYDFHDFFFFFWPHSMVCGNLVIQKGIEPRSMVLKAWSLNHWTTGEFPMTFMIYS